MRATPFAVLLLVAGCGGGDDNGAMSSPGSAAPAAAVVVTTAVAAPAFRDAAAETGLNFSHFIGASDQYYMLEVMGSGGALFDYDGDGDLDVYLLQGSMIEAGKPAAASTFAPPDQAWPGARLFRNQLAETGALAFADVTASSGLTFEGYGMGATVGDIDNDGDADLYLTAYGPNRLYRNNGDGTFSDITATAGVDDDKWSTAAGFQDYDKDGDLDLLVVNYVDFDPSRNTVCTSPGGRRDYCGPQVYPALNDRLFRNDGEGRFTDVGNSQGVGRKAGPGLGLVWADFNGDGWADAYVANDGAANFMWMNQQGNGFEDAALMSGTALNNMGSPEASMGVTAGDFDSDGDEDLFMTHLVKESNTLYTNDGSANFIDATDRYALGGASMSFTGFGSKWFDFDNDADLDLFVANGNVKIEESRIGQSDYPFEQANQLLRNDNGQRFTDISADGGDVLNLLEVSRGAAFGDVDNDGDVDVLVTNNNGPVRLMLNEYPHQGHWLRVTLRGTRSNRDGAGARVAVLRTGQPPLWRRAGTEGSYLSASDIRVHFGLGNSPAIDAVAVIWPLGTRELWRDVGVDRDLQLEEGTGTPWPADGL